MLKVGDIVDWATDEYPERIGGLILSEGIDDWSGRHLCQVSWPGWNANHRWYADDLVLSEFLLSPAYEELFE